jgi:Mycobacterium membrane protein
MKGSRMQRVSISRRLGQRWMLLVAVVVVAVAGFAVYRLHGIFASHDVTSTPSGSDNDIVPFNPKHVVMEVFGPPGAVATITYLDVNAQPQRVDATTLPWAYDTTTTQPAVFVNVSAQGDRDSIGCRIKIDDVVKDERSVNTLNAFTYCLDKSG